MKGFFIQELLKPVYCNTMYSQEAGCMKQIVIIGAGTAGITAAGELRKIHSAEEMGVTVITREVPPDYSRIRLPEFLAGAVTKEQLVIHNAQWFSSNGITVCAPAEVARIDREGKSLSVMVNGEARSVAYDALILATGSFPFTPGMPEPGSPSYGSVFALRTLEDAEKIKAHTASRRESAAVLGGGLLGLEAARALKNSGIKTVHVLETAGWLLPRQLDATASGLLKDYLEAEGLTIHTGASVDTSAFGVRSVSEVLEPVCGAGVETALYSMGVRSNKSLAEEAGIPCGRGIIINNETATGDPDIFAAGDCAEFEGVSWGIVPAALEQGKKAAQFAAGRLFPDDARPSPYVQTVPRREAVSAGTAVLTPEQEKSGGWISRTPSLEGDLYLRVLEDAETGLVSGALVFGPEGTGRFWLTKLQQAVGKPCPDEWK